MASRLNGEGGGSGAPCFRRPERFVQAQGRKEVLVSPYAPNYFWPGVDPKAYPEAVELLERRGYQTLYSPVAMDKNLVGFFVPPEVEALEAQRTREGYRFGPLAYEYLHDVIAFAEEAFNPDWGRAIRDAIKSGVPLDQCWIALSGEGRVVGFALFGGYDGILERFGPFGVDPSQRGKGLGKILLYRSLEAMRAKARTAPGFCGPGGDCGGPTLPQSRLCDHPVLSGDEAAAVKG